MHSRYSNASFLSSRLEWVNIMKMHAAAIAAGGLLGVGQRHSHAECNCCAHCCAGQAVPEHKRTILLQ
jgi:hypothetical protein